MQLPLVLAGLFLVTLVSAASPSQPAEQASSASVPQNVAVVGAPNVLESSQQAPNVVEHAVHSHQPAPGYYSPPGVVQVVGPEQVVKPQVGAVGSQVVRAVEQYGQPESASIPANYKPFGSWGLYIGGNPADGYYTNFYKALSNSVDKQQAGEPVAPVSGQFVGAQVKPSSQVSAFSPVVRQAGSSPYGAGDFYPFAYSTSDFSSSAHPVHYAAGQVVSPVQAGAQVYGAPQSFESNYPSAYPEQYATKKVGVAYVQKEVGATKDVPPAPVNAKGYQSRVYVYPPAASAAPSSPFAAPLQAPVAAQQQVVAYPVPVGSQIVGSQPGVEGSFSPYGVHAFTRYAIKPAVVGQQDAYPAGYQYAYQANNQAYPFYKQAGAVYQPAAQSYAGSSYYPLSYYGYPVGQPLHYSHGAVAGAPQVSFGESPIVHHSPVSVESDKIEAVEAEKAQLNKQQ